MRRSHLAVLIGAATFVVVLSVMFWAGNAVSERNVVAAFISGVSLGSIYAIAASGLVVSYTTSGVFNFAQGAIGMFMAFVYWELRVNDHLPAPLALFLAIFVLAPLFGILLDRLIMRRIVGTQLVVQLVVTIGIMLTLMGLVTIIWNPSQPRTIEFFFGTSGFHIGQTFVLWHRFIAVGTGIAIAAGLRVLLYRTRLGIAMRAVVDNRGLAALNGARPEVVSMFAWALGSMLAAVSGILLAPEVLLRVDALTLLILDAFAAAILGRLRHLPFTFAGGLLLGLLNAYALGFLDFDRKFSGRFANFPAAIPTVFLFIVLLALPQARIELGRLGPRIHSPHVPTIRQAAAGGAALVAAIAVVSAQLSLVNQNRLTLGLLSGLIMLSLVPLTGWGGQVNLAPITFAGVGAWMMLEVSGHSGNPVGLLAAAALAVPFGLAMTGPALRLQGLYLALASMAFARAAELLFFTQPEVFANDSRHLVRIALFGYRFDSQRAFVVLVAVVFAAMGVGLVWLRRSRFGRRLVAMRDSPAACATMGVNIPMTKLLVFSLSAAMAGFGGALLAVHRATAGQQDFQMLGGLPLVLEVVVGGVAMVSGALFGGIFSITLIMVKETWHLSWLQSLEILGPGTAALGVAGAPNGAAAQIATRLAPFLPWRPDARAEARAERRRRRDADPGRLGLARSFTDEDLVALDDALRVPDRFRAGPLLSSPATSAARSVGAVAAAGTRFGPA